MTTEATIRRLSLVLGVVLVVVGADFKDTTYVGGILLMGAGVALLLGFADRV